MSVQSQIAAGIEPKATGFGDDTPLMSIAVSLKRIADCLDPPDVPPRLHDMAESMATMAELMDIIVVHAGEMARRLNNIESALT